MAIYDDGVTGKMVQRTLARQPQRKSNAFMYDPLGGTPGMQYMGFNTPASMQEALPAADPIMQQPVAQRGGAGGFGLLNMAAGATALGALGQVGLGIYQMRNQKRLQERFDKQQKAMFSQSLKPIQENKGIYERQERMGLNPEAIALAKGTAAGQSASQFRAATDLAGGQLGSALGRIGAMNTNQLGLSLGAQDQQARERARVGIASANREISQVERMDIQRKQRMEDMTMQQIAGLRQDAMQNIGGALGAIPSGLSNLAYIKALSGTKNAAQGVEDYIIIIIWQKIFRFWMLLVKGVLLTSHSKGLRHWVLLLMLLLSKKQKKTRLRKNNWGKLPKWLRHQLKCTSW
jgi:hypothetical protein